MTSADLDEVAEDEFDEEDVEEEDERAGHTHRWVRYVMPVMVEVDCDTDEIASVVTLPGEVRLGRDDMMDTAGPGRCTSGCSAFTSAAWSPASSRASQEDKR